MDVSTTITLDLLGFAALALAIAARRGERWSAAMALTAGAAAIFGAALVSWAVMAVRKGS